MRALKYCANGCLAPPSPPSLVLCQKCKDEVKVVLEKILKEMQLEGKG